MPPADPPRGLLVVADTTPLLYLARTGLLDLLPRLFRRVIVPRTVWEELVVARPDAEDVPTLRAATWLEIDPGADGSAQMLALADNLDPGEAAAIALALLRGADLLLIDDLDGRRAATARGLSIRGTLGVLVEATRAGLLPALRPALDTLLGAGFRLDERLARLALEAVGEDA
jgi:predicted nucleic acid-binding protein